MASLQSFLAEAKDIVGKKKVYVGSEALNRRQEMKYSMMGKKKKMATMSSSMFLMSDFGVPMWKRALIEASEGAKTIGGVVKDIASKKVYTDPKKAAMWQGDLGRGFKEARDRVKQSLSKADKADIAKQLEKNKKVTQEEFVRKARNNAEQKYKAGGLRDLAPTPRMEPEGLLQVDKRYKIGKDDRTKMPVISEITTIQKGRLKSANS